ncbi:asparaginyl-tRNA synthetase [Multifurca ochricompacta]|uniref:asparagine--tRNA ligase n=1 Tax=Multifurca ochricompacta TaxID=376703 RepID=A0AAD4QNF4_9AGAM|nr:asparaginyl-tRNA synthetase [Multifurca ochricompacta]
MSRLPLQLISAFNPTRLGRTIRQVLASNPDEEIIQVHGWIKSVRLQKRIAFAMIQDGTTPRSLQAVFRDPEHAKVLTNGASVCITGVLTASPGSGQAKELLAETVEVLGACDPETYPIQKQALTTEYLRDHAHLRVRTDVHGAVLRLRDTVMRSLHEFFQNNDFIYAHTPIITSNDAEGAERLSAPSYLTVSSQLHLEVISNAVARVWTLSPCFRAERSQTSRHLAEFWMLEAEWAFVRSVDDLCNVAEASIKHVLRLNSPDRDLLQKDINASCGLVAAASDIPWPRITYTDAIHELQKSGSRFEFPPTWGAALQSEHERWLADSFARGPIFVTDYPTAIKPFYMRQNDDSRTVACFDLLVPHIGELVGGSLREERPTLLEAAIKRQGLDEEVYRWYTELRRFGGAPHGGYGMGFERLISWLGGIENVRECIPMPRWSGRMLL